MEVDILSPSDNYTIGLDILKTAMLKLETGWFFSYGSVKKKTPLQHIFYTLSVESLFTLTTI